LFNFFIHVLHTLYITYIHCIYTYVYIHVQTFAVKFADAEIAAEFKEKFSAGQDEMKTLMAGGDAAEGGAEADEAAEALASLAVKKEDAEA
jgi:hypothetical protein